jgi:hypothetical protein
MQETFMPAAVLRLCAAGLLAATCAGGAVSADALDAPAVVRVQAGGGDNQGLNEEAEHRNRRFDNRLRFRSDWRERQAWRDRQSWRERRAERERRAWRDRRDRDEIGDLIGSLLGR